MRFPMTLDGFTKSITVGSMVLVGLLLPAQYFLVVSRIPSTLFKVLVMGTLCVVALLLLWTVALAPRAVRVSSGKLIIERLWWFDFILPMSEVIGVEEGPPLTMFGKVWRVAGNGGLMGFTGLFHVSHVGVVRCWATRLGVPTVLVKRAHAKPMLLGVDDPEGLLRALRQKTHFSATFPSP
jgi:hypothetical protein